MPELREAIADWYRQRFGVTLDPATEVLPLIGSKEGIAHLPVAFLNKGDVALVPDPGYPPYRNATILADGKPYAMPLRQSNGFLPDLDAVSSAVADKARLMFLNYPNNPTGAVADSAFFEKVVAFAQAHQVVICHDAAYSEVAFDGFKAVSFLQTPGAKDVGVEFHSLSKTYNMTGWRLGWVAAMRGWWRHWRELNQHRFRHFPGYPDGGLAALREGSSVIEAEQQDLRRTVPGLCGVLNSLGGRPKPKASFYMWVKLPKKAKSSVEFARILLEGQYSWPRRCGVGFGKYGEGYVRFAMTLDKARLQEAIERMKVYLVDQFERAQDDLLYRLGF
jgi:LL-diaminopimelate aminotransferase